MDLKSKISEYKDFPKKGILFRDFNPILKDPHALSLVVDEFSKKFHPNDVDVFAGIESRGFILACALAQKYNKGMILLRKSGKLPGKTIKVSYTIEYGKAQMEIQKTALEKNERVDKILLRYMTIKVKKFDLTTNYFSKQNDNKEIEKRKVR